MKPHSGSGRNVLDFLQEILPLEPAAMDVLSRGNLWIKQVLGLCLVSTSLVRKDYSGTIKRESSHEEYSNKSEKNIKIFVNTSNMLKHLK